MLVLYNLRRGVGRWRWTRSWGRRRKGGRKRRRKGGFNLCSRYRFRMFRRIEN